MKIIKQKTKCFVLLFLIILLLISSISLPIVIKYYNNNRELLIAKEINSNDELIRMSFNDIMDLIINVSNKFKKELRANLSYDNLQRLNNSLLKSSYIIHVYDYNENLILWNNESLLYNKNYSIRDNLGKILFYDNDVIVYLSFIDLIHYKSNIYY